MFAPEEINRQEMFTLLTTLKVINKLPGAIPAGRSQTSATPGTRPWAKEAMKLLVETGTIGSGKLCLRTPAGHQMAQVLYSC